jgi:cytochrome P450
LATGSSFLSCCIEARGAPASHIDQKASKQIPYLAGPRPWTGRLDARHYNYVGIAEKSASGGRYNFRQLALQRITLNAKALPARQSSGAPLLKLTDLTSTEFYRNPYPLYETLRQAGKLVPGAPGILLTGHYDIVNALLLDRKMGKGYMQSIVARYGEKGPRQPAFQALAKMFLMMNPPEHTRLRSLLMKAFDMRSIETLRTITQRVADELITAFPADAPFDLVSGYMQPLPVRIICRIDAMALGETVSRLVASLEAAPLNDAALAKVNDAAQTLESYFKDVVHKRRLNPGTDLISMLLAVDEDGVRLSDDEIVSNVMLLFAAGHETTANMMGNALISLHRHPAQLDMLKQSPELLPRAIAECLRYDSSVQFLTRMAIEDTEFDGIALPKGTLVFMFLGAANRDPQRFPDAEEFIIDRPQTDNRLIMFGGGLHYCLGARLATMELQIAIQSLLARVPALRLLNLEELRWHPRNTLRGVESLMAHC